MELSRIIAGGLIGDGTIHHRAKGTPGPGQMLSSYSILYGAKNDEEGATLHSALVVAKCAKENFQNPSGPAHGFPHLFDYPRDRLSRDQVATIFKNIVRGEPIPVTFWNRRIIAC